MATASDKEVAKIREWLKTQPADKQSRLGDMLQKGLIKEVKAELPAGWASKQAPAQSVPAEAKAPKAKSGKLKSVASNPAAKATKDAVTAEVSATAKAAADTAGKAAADTAGKAKGYFGNLGDEAKVIGKGIKKNVGKAAGGLYLGANVLGRGKEFVDDVSAGKSFGEALDKPKSNRQLARAAVDTGLAAAGIKLGGLAGGALRVPTIGATAGGIALPMAGNYVMNKLGILQDEPTTKVDGAKTEPAKTMPSISFNEASDWLKANNMDATEGNFQKAFQELNKKQQEQINKTPEPKPSADTFKPSAKESIAMAEQAVKAPIGMQDKAPEPDIMSFLNNPDTQGMIAELAAKQANRVQSAGNIPDFKPRKKNEEDEDGMSPSSTTTANVRPPPRFFVNTGRFGTMAGGGSRRSPSGRLL
jgi:hypothetical protein